jgi:hypothetical protein
MRRSMILDLVVKVDRIISANTLVDIVMKYGLG